MTSLALIGGTGLSTMEGMMIRSRLSVDTPYGNPSSDLTCGTLYGQELVFLARHGDAHTIAPHKINYRANIWALKSVGVEQIIAIGAVGGIADQCGPTIIVVPDQIIDYTCNRDHTYYDDEGAGLDHIGFSYPYTKSLREALIIAAAQAGVDPVNKGTYGITQGPRLESAAEIVRMRNDGCSIVGMTGMPEAALAREQGLDYASLTMVVNWAAGIEKEEIDFKAVEDFIKLGTEHIGKVLKVFMSHRTNNGI